MQEDQFICKCNQALLTPTLINVVKGIKVYLDRLGFILYTAKGVFFLYIHCLFRRLYASAGGPCVPFPVGALFCSCNFRFGLNLVVNLNLSFYFLLLVMKFEQCPSGEHRLGLASNQSEGTDWRWTLCSRAREGGDGKSRCAEDRCRRGRCIDPSRCKVTGLDELIN
jgi:hypothetical protein